MEEVADLEETEDKSDQDTQNHTIKIRMLIGIFPSLIRTG